MSIYCDENTKVIYQGYSPGRPGAFYAGTNREYGTKVVGGVNPGRAGQEHEGIPIFGSVKDAIEKTGANAPCVFVPAQGTASAVMEAAEAGILAPEPLYTHRYPLSRLGEALDATRDHPEGFVKALVTMP